MSYVAPEGWAFSLILAIKYVKIFAVYFLCLSKLHLRCSMRCYKKSRHSIPNPVTRFALKFSTAVKGLTNQNLCWKQKNNHNNVLQCLYILHFNNCIFQACGALKLLETKVADVKLTEEV